MGTKVFKVKISKGNSRVTKSVDLFDEMESPKKKKLVSKKPSKDLYEEKPQKKQLPAVITPMPATRTGPISKTNLSKLESLFGDRTEQILDMLENNQRDGAITLLYRQLLSMTVDVIPLAENLVRSSNGAKGVYQINALVSQARELLADIQSTQDRGALGRNMVERHVRPAFLDVAMQIVNSNHLLLTSLLPIVPDQRKEKVREMFQSNQKQLAMYIQSQYESIRDELMRGLT